MSPVTLVLLLQQPMKAHHIDAFLPRAVTGAHLKKWTPRLLMPSINLPGSSPMGSSILFTEKKMELPAGVQTGTTQGPCVLKADTLGGTGWLLLQQHAKALPGTADSTL